MPILSCAMCGGVVEMTLTGAVLTITAVAPIMADYARRLRPRPRPVPLPPVETRAARSLVETRERLAELTTG